jgi:hypothetical protein
MAKKKKSEMEYSHQVFWGVVVINLITGTYASIPSDIDTIVRVLIFYINLLVVALTGLFIFRKTTKNIFIVFNIILILTGWFVLKPYNDSSLIKNEAKTSGFANPQIETEYRKQIDLVLQAGNALTRRKMYDGNTSNGATLGHLNRSFYPKLTDWRNSVAENIPEVYSIYFYTEEDTNNFYQRYVKKNNYDPAGYKEKYIGNLYNTTFESLKFLRDNPLFYVKLEHIHN